MIALPDRPTGADLVAAVRAHAQETGQPPNTLFRLLSSHPDRWASQVAGAMKPKPRTIARVRALLDGKLASPGAPYHPKLRHGKGGAEAEIEIQRRLDEGQTRERIVEETGIHPTIVASVAGRSSESATLAMKADLRSGSAKLRAAIFAESAAKEERRLAAQAWSGASALDSAAARPIEFFAPSAGADARPPAFSREACSRCGARGDIGCRHQLPYDPQEAARC